MFVFRAAVVGAGTLGSGIAETIEASGIPVLLGEMGGSYDGFGEVDLVVAVVPEDLEPGQELFAELDEVTPGRAILASAASSLSITELGEATIRPDKVVGLHFFPAGGSRVVEVIEGESTSPETVQAATAFVGRLRRTPIPLLDAPGFVVNRILLSAVSEIWRLQQQTGADYAELDAALTAEQSDPQGGGSSTARRPATQSLEGPFQLADTLGLDTVLQIAEYLEESFGDRFAVHPRLRELVVSGDLGRKTGRGFYDYG